MPNSSLCPLFFFFSLLQFVLFVSILVLGGKCFFSPISREERPTSKAKAGTIFSTPKGCDSFFIIYIYIYIKNRLLLLVS